MSKESKMVYEYAAKTVLGIILIAAVCILIGLCLSVLGPVGYYVSGVVTVLGVYTAIELTTAIIKAALKEKEEEKKEEP